MRKVSFQSYCKLNGAQPSNLTDRSAEIGRHPRSSLPLPYFGRLNKLIERTQYSPSRRASRDEPRFSQKSDCYYRRLKWVWKGHRSRVGPPGNVFGFGRPSRPALDWGRNARRLVATHTLFLPMSAARTMWQSWRKLPFQNSAIDIWVNNAGVGVFTNHPRKERK